MYDFCLTPFFSGILVLGGLFANWHKGSAISLATSLVAGGLIALLGYANMRNYHKGFVSNAVLGAEAAIAGTAWVVILARCVHTGSYLDVAHVISWLSGGMMCFFLWALSLGPRPKPAWRPRDQKTK